MCALRPPESLSTLTECRGGVGVPPAPEAYAGELTVVAFREPWVPRVLRRHHRDDPHPARRPNSTQDNPRQPWKMENMRRLPQLHL